MRILPLLLAILFCMGAMAQDLPVDAHATKETRQLYKNLKSAISKGILFGHQDDLAYGYNWKYEKGRSDIRDVTGDYPAVYGWELGRLEIDWLHNLDSVPFTRMKELIRDGYERGGVITISWHLNNPLTGKSAWDPAPGTVASVLPGGTKHQLYTQWLNKVADFFNTLKGKRGEYIPVIFRPFHELNGSWFWWGKNHCSPQEIKELFRFTVQYLRDEKKLHHLLYAFNTDRFTSKEEYLERFPGDEWVDIIGFDIYQRNNNHSAFEKDVDGMLSTLVRIAQEKNKIPALTEFGYSGLPAVRWWTETFWKAIEKHQISFVLAWRNAGKKSDGSEEFYVPYKQQQSAVDFVRFYKLKRTLFGKDAGRLKLYR